MLYGIGLVLGAGSVLGTALKLEASGIMAYYFLADSKIPAFRF